MSQGKRFQRCTRFISAWHRSMALQHQAAIRECRRAEFGLGRNQHRPPRPHADLAIGFCSKRAPPQDPSGLLPKPHSGG